MWWKTTILICGAAMLIGSNAALADILYVDADATGANDGSSWENAFIDLQDALTAAEDGDEIRVAQGTYKPDQGAGVTPGDREATFQLINGVALKGGYAGHGEEDPDARNIEAYESILSGDLNDNDSVVANPRDLSDEPTRSENSIHVVTGSNTEATAILDGFTITAGNAHGDFATDPDNDHGRGGGMVIDDGSPTVRNCMFRDNSADWFGGAVFNAGGSDTSFFNITFVNNGTGDLSHAGYVSGGGALGITESAPSFFGCQFIGNESRWAGALLSVYGSRVVLAECSFVENEALEGEGGAVHSTYDSDLLITGSLFVGNAAADRGGAVCDNGGGSTVRNCTVYGNSAGVRGGGLCALAGTMDIQSCILWGNTAGVQESQIGIGGGVQVTVAYSDVDGGVWWGGVGNMDVDPAFVNPDSGDFHLKSQAGHFHPGGWVLDDVTSPCIDAGDPMSPIGLEAFPNGGRINMGAYGGMAEASKSYFGTEPCETIVAGDINGDCRINMLDLAIIALHWLEDSH